MGDPECFEIGMSYEGATWPYVIHNTDKDGLYYFKDHEFKAHHYANKEAFAEAILAHGGTKCSRCNLYHRDIDDLCDDCKKITEVFDASVLQDDHDYNR